MNAEQIAMARTCLAGAHDGSLSFPEIVGALIQAGFEGFTVDFRRHCQTFFLPDGRHLDLQMPQGSGAVAAAFDAAGVASLVRWAQAGGPDYRYPAFCERIKAAGCAGYLVSFLGRRVVYFGRTAETHVEVFP